MLTTQIQVATRVVTTSPCPEVTDLELDAILKLTEVARAQALIYADDQEDQIAQYLQESYDDVMYHFSDGQSPNARTRIIFQTVHNLLFAA